MDENKISNFLESSFKLIDDVDIDREMNAEQVKYAAKLFKNDLEANELMCKINGLNNKTSRINQNTDDKIGELKKIQDSLVQFF